MANYAFGRRRQVQPNATFQSNFLKQLEGAPLQRAGWDATPEEAYNRWMSFMPSLSARDDNTLRQIFSRLHSNYLSHNYAAIENQDNGAYTSFFDYLSNINPEYQIQQFGPAARRQENRAYTTPLRWLSF